VSATAHLAAVHVYRNGLDVCSVCAPGEMTSEQVAEAVNVQDGQALSGAGLEHRVGTTPQWHVSDDKTFKGGETNPCPCNDMPARKHWLLEC